MTASRWAQKYLRSGRSSNQQSHQQQRTNACTNIDTLNNQQYSGTDKHIPPHLAQSHHHVTSTMV